MMSEELATYKYAVFMEISGHRKSLDIYIKNILKVTQLELGTKNDICILQL